MKKLLLAAMLALAVPAQAEINVFGGFYVFDEEQTNEDYKGLSPLGRFGIEYRHHVSNKFSIAVGYEHNSSIGYREKGKGFNGPFVEGKLRLF